MAGHVGDPQTARQGLADSDPAVREAALRSLARLGALADDELRAGLGDPAARVRLAAVELAAPNGDIDVSALLADPDDSVVEQAAWCCGERPEDLRPLERLAALSSGHDDPLVREAAVAALGALGDEAGRAAVLAAVTDKPAVRRRALVALAAFSGPDVDEANERARSDPDRQVRDIVDDLVGPLGLDGLSEPGDDR